MHPEEHLLCVYGDLACVIRAMFWKVGVPHVVVWDVLLFQALWVIIRVDGGYGIVAWFLDY